MIPVERVTELLYQHEWEPRSDSWWEPYGKCKCGHDTAHDGDWKPYDKGNHNHHVAGVLADAGLIPTEREWGVRIPESYLNDETHVHTYEQAEVEKKLVGYAKQGYPGAHVVSRHVTAWTAEEAGR